MTSDPAAWAIDALGETDLGDQRRRARLLQMLTDLGAQPASGVSQACGETSASVGTYRFWQNPEVDPGTMLASSGRATAQRCAAAGVDPVLLVQDTTDIVPGARHRCQGLGPVNSGGDLGIKLHTTLAVSEDGLPVGVLDQRAWTRDPDDRGRKVRRYQTPVEGKESRKWLDGLQAASARLQPEQASITVADREADVFELYALHQAQGGDFVIRAAQNRRLVGSAATVATAAAQLPQRGQLTVRVPRGDGRPERSATVTLRSGQVTLQPPGYQSYAKARRQWWQDHPDVLPLVEYPLEPLTVGLVEVHEEVAPDAHQPLHWRLLTTLPVATLAEAARCIQIYRQRWMVERFHYVLKQGCRVEQLQLASVDRMERALATYSLVAWQVLWITLLSRQVPEVSCEQVVSRSTWQALHAHQHRTRTMPATPPDLVTFVGMLGRLGGHLGRTRDGPPGVRTLWRGWQQLTPMVVLWEALTASPPVRTTCE